MSFLLQLKAKWGIHRLRQRIAKAKSDHAHEALRMEFEFKKKEVKIARLCEDNRLALKRAKEDWNLESAFVSDHIEDLEARLLSEIVQHEHIKASPSRPGQAYPQPLQMVSKDAS